LALWRALFGVRTGRAKWGMAGGIILLALGLKRGLCAFTLMGYQFTFQGLDRVGLHGVADA